MKDREPNELTDQSKSPNLERGDIFMTDGPSDSEHNKPADPNEHEIVAPIAETLIPVEIGPAPMEEGDEGESDFSSPEESRHAAEADKKVSILAEQEVESLMSTYSEDFDTLTMTNDKGEEVTVHSTPELMRQARRGMSEQRTTGYKRLRTSRQAIERFTHDVSRSSDAESTRTALQGFLEEAAKIRPLISSLDKQDMEYGGIRGFDNLFNELNNRNTPPDKAREIVEYLSPKIIAHYNYKEN